MTHKRFIPDKTHLTMISIICYILLINLTISPRIISATKDVLEKIESSKRISKRSTFDEFGHTDFHQKLRNDQPPTNNFVRSPRPGYQGWIDRSIGKRAGQVQGAVGDDRNVFERSSNDRKQKDLDLIPLGCFSTWERQYTSFVSPATRYSPSYDADSCAQQCREYHEDHQISVLKGAECRCIQVFGFNSTLVEEAKCDIPCPLEDYDPAKSDHLSPSNSCGGNLAFSAYCRANGPNDCNEVVERSKRFRKTLQSTNVDRTGIRSGGLSDVLDKLEKECTVCDIRVNGECVRAFHAPNYDYFPINTPSKCVDYCANNVTYVQVNKEPVVRNSTPFALLFWVKEDGQILPMCRCLNENERNWFETVGDASECSTMTCPGKPSTLCGGRPQDDDNRYFARTYCTMGKDEEGKCIMESGGGGTTKPTTTDSTTEEHSTESTTEEHSTDSTTYTPTSPETTTTDECSDAEIGCDPSETTEPPWSTTWPGTDTTTEIDYSPTEPTTRSTNITITTTKLATTPTTTTSRSTTTTSCINYCEATDKYGYFWRACYNATEFIACHHLLANSSNDLASWFCTVTGNFDTPQPDVSKCRSEWLEHKKEELENIKDIDAADDYVQAMSDACKDAWRKNSTTKYYGHEIQSISAYTNEAVSKAKNNHKNFTAFENVVRKAVDLGAYLIHYHEPWEGMPDPQKSSISTNLIRNTEKSLFYLTRAVNTSYRIYVSENPADTPKFIMTAETFNKAGGNSYAGGYEFPSQDKRDSRSSFIKLPPGWTEQVSNNKVEIAGMSFDSEYVSYVMPGQFEKLGAGSTAAPGVSKVINGKLISFTLSSSAGSSSELSSPSTHFTGKGVEIHFQHDLEAWGDEAYEVPRKLHDGERPKAVLGTTLCAYWDVNALKWATDGCKVISSNHFETVCECSHLTAFAVLMDIHKYVGKDFALELLTLILCPLSQVALVLSIILLSTANGLQRIRATITRNLSICLLLGNIMVMIVLDKNYTHMSKNLCTGAAIVTHYIFLSAFMWMLIEGVQLYRMVVHVFDSGRSYIKHFGIFAYGLPLIVVAITATIGYLKGDRPYGGDVYCWLDGYYIWSFMGPVAIVIMINFVVLFIALKTAYQLQQNKKHSPTFLMGKIRSCKTWFKGCFSLTVILGLTWVVGFFTLMKSPTGIIAAYLFTLLNASQGIFIFLFHCLLNDKVRAFTKRSFSTYLPSWLSSSVSSNPNGPEGSSYEKRQWSSTKTKQSVLNKRAQNKPDRKLSSPAELREPYIISNMKAHSDLGIHQIGRQALDKDSGLIEAKNRIHVPFKRCESVGTLSSLDSIPHCSMSDNEHNMSSDNSQYALISSRFRTKR